MNIHNINLPTQITRSCLKRKNVASRIKFMEKIISKTSQKSRFLLRSKIQKENQKTKSLMIIMNEIQVQETHLLIPKTVSTPQMSSFMKILKTVILKQAASRPLSLTDKEWTLTKMLLPHLCMHLTWRKVTQRKWENRMFQRLKYFRRLKCSKRRTEYPQELTEPKTKLIWIH